MICDTAAQQAPAESGITHHGRIQFQHIVFYVMEILKKTLGNQQLVLAEFPIGLIEKEDTKSVIIMMGTQTGIMNMKSIKKNLWWIAPISLWAIIMIISLISNEVING